MQSLLAGEYQFEIDNEYIHSSLIVGSVICFLTIFYSGIQLVNYILTGGISYTSKYNPDNKINSMLLMDPDTENEANPHNLQQNFQSQQQQQQEYQVPEIIYPQQEHRFPNLNLAPMNIAGVEIKEMNFRDQFEGEPDLNSKHHAFTYWKVKYTYNTRVNKERNIREFQYLNAGVYIEETSWIKWEKVQGDRQQELLNHENGHYLLGILCALRFKQFFQENDIPIAEYSDFITQAFKQQLDEIKELEKYYDKTTLHMDDPEQQYIFDKFLFEQIQLYSLYFQPGMKQGAMLKLITKIKDSYQKMIKKMEKENNILSDLNEEETQEQQRNTEDIEKQKHNTIDINSIHQQNAMQISHGQDSERKSVISLAFTEDNNQQEYQVETNYSIKEAVNELEKNKYKLVYELSCFLDLFMDKYIFILFLEIFLVLNWGSYLMAGITCLIIIFLAFLENQAEMYRRKNESFQKAFQRSQKFKFFINISLAIILTIHLWNYLAVNQKYNNVHPEPSKGYFVLQK